MARLYCLQSRFLRVYIRDSSCLIIPPKQLCRAFLVPPTSQHCHSKHLFYIHLQQAVFLSLSCRGL